MFKKLLLVGMIATLTGCATHYQSNQAAGALAGAIVGNAISHGSGIRAAATLMGAAVGASLGAQQPVQPYMYPAPGVVVLPGHPTYPYPYPYGYATIRPDYSVCDHWTHQERDACRRGADVRARAEQNRLNREAYNRGFHGN